MTSSPAVVLVEDDATLRTIVGDYLRADGYDVTLFGDGFDASVALHEALPDLLIVDRMLPGMSGDELCRQVRAVSDVPILMLTALGTVEDRIEGLERGADDYLPKPFAMRELQLRVRSMLRRSSAPEVSSTFTVGPFRIDPTHRRVWNGGREVVLTTREYDLMLHLTQHRNEVLTRDDILREVWGWNVGDASTVTVHVRRLREKIEPDSRHPRFLLTEWGAGYRFVTEEGDHALIQ